MSIHFILAHTYIFHMQCYDIFEINCTHQLPLEVICMIIYDITLHLNYYFKLSVCCKNISLKKLLQLFIVLESKEARQPSLYEPIHCKIFYLYRQHPTHITFNEEIKTCRLTRAQPQDYMYRKGKLSHREISPGSRGFFRENECRTRNDQTEFV